MKSVRIGPKMRLALQLSSVPGGRSRISLAKQVGPNGSLKYGYAIVNRLIKSGLVATGFVPGRRGLMVSSME